MIRYKLKPKYQQDVIICKDEDGNDYLIRNHAFTDKDAINLINSGKQHLVEIIKS
jgi:hypothetical protein